MAQVQTDLRRCILRAFVGRGLLESCDAKEMLGYQHSEPGSDKRGAKLDELHLTPLELIARIAALVPPPRTHRHRHRYFGVLAPNSPLRSAVTALAAPAKPVVMQTEPAATGEGAPGVAPLDHAIPSTPESAPPKRAQAHYRWAVLIARVLRPCGTDRSYAQRTSSVLN